MTTIAEVRAGLVVAINTGLGGTPWYAAAYVGEQVNPPEIKVSLPAFDPRFVFGEAKKSVTFRVTAYATRAGGDASEILLDALCEPTGTTGSLIGAVQTSTNWAITVDFAQVTQVGEIGVTTYGTNDVAEYFFRPFDVEVVW